MYFKQKENTNIDKALRKRKKINLDKKTLKIAGIVLGIIILIAIIVLIITNTFRYFLVLNGNKNITIYQGSIYTEPGYRAYDRQKNDLNSEVTINSNLDTNTIGTYKITYSLYNKVKTRTIKVVAKPAVATVIHLNGDKNVYLSVGTTYNEPGYSAIDALDGDLTSKVKVNSNVNTTKRGTYRIVYSVVNSDGVTTSETRTIIVQ